MSSICNVDSNEEGDTDEISDEPENNNKESDYNINKRKLMLLVAGYIYKHNTILSMDIIKLVFKYYFSINQHISFLQLNRKYVTVINSNQATNFRQIDNALHIYYQRLRKLNYVDDNGIGIFLKFAIKNEENFDGIEEQLGWGRTPNDCFYELIWDDIPFPIPDYVNIADDKAKTSFIFHILQYCYKFRSAPTDEYIKWQIIPKIGASLKATKQYHYKQIDQQQPNASNCKKNRNKNKIDVIAKDGRSYKPMFDAKSIIRIERKLTGKGKIIKQRIKKQIENVYQYMMAIISISLYPNNILIINDNIWILPFDLFIDKNTAQQLFCIADKVNERKSSNTFKWKMRNILYTAEEIWNELNPSNLSINALPIAPQFINSPKYMLEMQNVDRMAAILSNPDIREQEIFSTKKPWHKLTIFKNNAKINAFQVKLGMSKPDFLTRCKNEAKKENFKLIPILLFNHKSNDRYCIDALWIVEIWENRYIGISFKYNQNKQMVQESGIHLDIEFMKIQCELANPQQSTSIDGYFNNATSEINDLSIDNYNSEQYKSNRLENENKKLKEELKYYKEQQNKS